MPFLFYAGVRTSPKNRVLLLKTSVYVLNCYFFVYSGHIEMSGQPVDSFTQQDIDSGVISYVHGTNNEKQLNKTSLRLTLQVRKRTSFFHFTVFLSL